MTAGTVVEAPAPSVFVMGAGVVGTALAAWLARGGVSVLGLHGRQAAPSETPGGIVASAGDIPDTLSAADVVIIATRDERIPAVARRLVAERRLRPGQIVLHPSGAHAAAELLADARPHVRAVGTLHPLVSFADARLAIDGLAPIAFGIEGDERACEVSVRLVKALGGRAVRVDARGLPLYHAGAVFASNYVVALADVAKRLLVAAGVAPDQALPALIPLLSSVVQNLAQLGLPGALSGPVERGDVSTVEVHMQALEARVPELLALYGLGGREVLRVAREKSALDAETVKRLEGLFAGLSKPS